MRLTLKWPCPETILVAWAAYVIYVVWQSLTPQPDMPFTFDEADKLVHFLAYAGLAFMPFAGFRERRAAFLAALAMLAMGAALELCQSFVPERSASFLDMAANALGVACGAWAGKTLRARLDFPPP